MSRSTPLRSVRRIASDVNHLGDSPHEERQNILVAQRVMDQLAGLDPQPLPEVQTAVVPAGHFSGDQLVAERTPAGVMHLFLADGVGHGLVPALLALPLTRTFSTMSRKGFNLPTIVKELNRTIRQYRLPDQFVAVTLVAFDPFTGDLEVWNGGNPDGLLFDRDGNLLRRFKSTQLPLGVCDTTELDTTTVSTLAPDGAQLLLFSDGLVEAEGVRGEHFSERRLLTCVSRHAPDERVQAVLAEVRSHLGAQPAHDDISILSMDCVRKTAVARPTAGTEAADSVGRWLAQANWTCSLRLGAETLRRIDAVPVIQNFLRDINPAARDYSRQFVVLSELFNNALDHGLLKLDSSLKNGPEGMGPYMTERALRLSALREGEIVIEAAGAHHGGRRAICIKVRDSGGGFPHKDIFGAPRPAEATVPHGRGIALVRALADEFHYEGAGNVAQVLCCSDDMENNKEAA